MRLGICGIYELPRYNRAGSGLCQLFGFFDRAFHAFRTLGENDLRAVSLYDIPAFDAHRLGHGEYYFISSRRAYRRKPYAGIAGSRFDYDRPGEEFTVSFGGIDHRLGDPVFNRPRRVEIFEFSENPRFKIMFFSVFFEFQKRSSAYKFVNALINLHFGRLLFFACIISPKLAACQGLTAKNMLLRQKFANFFSQ